VDYRWRLSDHLLRYFAEHRLTAITVEEVDSVLRQSCQRWVSQPPEKRSSRRSFVNA
jgi:hypothetical protein